LFAEQAEQRRVLADGKDLSAGGRRAVGAKVPATSDHAHREIARAVAVPGRKIPSTSIHFGQRQGFLKIVDRP